MADVKGIVTKKIGPLPVWAYVVGGAAAVFLLGRFRGGPSSGGGAADVIKIPTLAPGSQSDTGDGAVGSPGQNASGGMSTQPGGVGPWWSDPPHPVETSPSSGSGDGSVGGSGNTGLQSSASSGRRPADGAFDFIGKTAGQIAEAGRLGFQRISPTAVSTGGNGVVAPTNVIVGFADPATGNLEPTPGPGRVPIYR